MTTTFGEFLKTKRQEKNLTQKDLAKSLFVSESAISKWEKNVAHPDITLLPKLSELLDVTEHELITASIDKSTRIEKQQAKKWRVLTLSWNLFFYIAYGITLLTCFICDLAISGKLTWFWIVFCALLLGFTFTNLPKFIKKLKLLILPLSMYIALCLLLVACSIFTKTYFWLWIAIFSVLQGLIIVLFPIYIAKYDIFKKIRKYNDFVSILVDFIFLNFLYLIIENYTLTINGEGWYLKIALPITLVIFVMLNVLLCIKFLKTNKSIKTSIILFLINLFIFIPPLFIKVDNIHIQEEIEDLNIFKANFSIWDVKTIDNNVSLIIALTLTLTTIAFLIRGLILHFKKKQK